jgi:hypothetical protein
VEIWTAKFWRFYWKCLSAPGKRWLLMAMIFTIIFFVPLVSGKMREAEYQNRLLFSGVLPMIVLCVFFVPLVEAYKLYAAKEQELADERQMREKETTKCKEQSNNLA